MLDLEEMLRLIAVNPASELLMSSNDYPKKVTLSKESKLGGKFFQSIKTQIQLCRQAAGSIFGRAGHPAEPVSSQKTRFKNWV